MSAGSIIIDLLLNTGSFETDTNRASKALQKSLKEAVGTVKELAAAFGVGLGAEAFKDLIAGSIEAAAHLDDLSKKTGIAADVLGGIGFAAKQAGGDLETAVAGANKLNKSLAEAASGTPEAAEAFKLLGVNVKDAQGNVKTADVVLAELADKFAGYADGPNKTALAIRIFGKAGADMIPVLDEGGAKLRENIAFFQQYSGVTVETAKAANEFQSTLAHLALIQGAFGQQLAAEFLPTLQTIADAFLDLKKNSTVLSDAASGLGDLFRGLTVIVSGFVFTIYEAARGLGALAAAAPSFAKGALLSQGGFNDEALDEYKKGTEILKDYGRDLDADANKAANFQKKLLSAGAAAAKVGTDFLRDEKGTYSAGDFRSKKPDAPGLAGKSAAEDAYTALMKQAQGLDAVAKAEGDALDAETKFTEAQKLQAKIATDYAAGLLKLTPAQLARLNATLKTTDADERATEAKKEDLKWLIAANSANADYLESQQKLRDTFEKQTEAARQLADQYGLSADESKRLNDQGLTNTAAALAAIAAYGHTKDSLNDLEVARKRDAAAALLERAAATPSADVAETLRQQAAAIAAEADALVDLAKKQKTAEQGFKDFFSQYKADSEDASKQAQAFAQTAVSGLEDSLTAFLTTGKGGFHALVDSIISEIERLYIVKPLIAGLFGSSGTNGSLGSLFSSASSSAGGIGSWFSGLFGGGGVGAGTVGGSNVSAAGVALESFAKGTPYVQKDGPVMVHEGERIMTKAENMAGGAQRGSTQTINVNVTATPGMSRDTANQQGAAIGQGIQRALARNT